MPSWWLFESAKKKAACMLSQPKSYLITSVLKHCQCKMRHIFLSIHIDLHSEWKPYQCLMIYLAMHYCFVFLFLYRILSPPTHPCRCAWTDRLNAGIGRVIYRKGHRTANERFYTYVIETTINAKSLSWTTGHSVVASRKKHPRLTSVWKHCQCK
jgi:hypothetical protein